MSCRRPPSIDQAEVAKFQAHFSDLFEKANLPGPDYHEFRAGLDSMADVVPSEDQRMKAAFKMLAPQGLTKERLVESANAYLDILKKDREKMKHTADEYVSKSAGPLLEEKQTLERGISSDEAMLKTIADRIEASRSRIAEITARVEEIQADAARGTSVYDHTASAIQSRIEGDISRITTTL